MKLLHYLKLGYGRTNFLLSKVTSKVEAMGSKLQSSENPEVRRSLVKELESLRLLTRSLAKMSAILEVLIIRVETLTLLSLTAKDLAVIKGVVQELKKYSFNIPELSIIIEDIDDKVNDLIRETRGNFNESSVSAVVGEDVRKVIGEAELIADSKLKDLGLHSGQVRT